MDHALLDAIAGLFIDSAKRGGFNGVVASVLLQLEASPEVLRSALSKLVRDGQISAVFSRVSANMHIKRLPDLPIAEQQELLTAEPLNEICVYPTASTVQLRVDLNAWRDRPFSKALLLADPQLSFRAFDMGALERYISDPRYVVHFADYIGTMSIGDEYFVDSHQPERDMVSLQTFGLGFDDKRNPYVVVYLRYLAGLSDEHQKYWHSYLASGDVRISEPYFRSSIYGEYWRNRSVRNAIVEEMRLIRALTNAIWGRSLFRNSIGGDVPIGLTSFLRPTAENFNRFVMALDKLLSEGIDSKFFEGKVPLETETLRPDGKIIVQNKGTLTLLEEWLLAEIVWEDPAAFREIVIRPLRKIRRLRQTPAHTFTLDSFSEEYHKKRKQLLSDVFNSLSNIRATFSKHPLAHHVQIPDWLDGGRIDVF
ncbi:hypothetical protein [Mesorhizobium sp. B2-3-12]|uniref:hypothetical protein n=1 Tax=Mesorhizobium sp. B2-3-12 TaxID=2589952 RepID=UPI001127FB47|nr:hypothetical protein [Mesorhizobium sp. B2-3-12]TPL95530.1 hypothetical protein FJ948_03750 [Mesorhizobium sp. B2-3-12]